MRRVSSGHRIARTALPLVFCFFSIAEVPTTTASSIGGGGAGQEWARVCEPGCKCLDRSVNLALGSTVDSPDDIEQDFCIGEREGCIDAWAADGDMNTYWDEIDNQQAAYRLRLRLSNASSSVPIAGLSIRGFARHNYAPRGFHVTCNQEIVKEVSNIVYTGNLFELCFPPVVCTEVELFIIDWYGGSPAIRELQLFGVQDVIQPNEATPQKTAKGGLLLPEGIGESECAHVAGETLMCIGRQGSAEECGAVRIKHWECIRDELVKGGHKSMNRLKEFRYGWVLYHPFDVYFAVAMELYGEWSELEMQLMRQYISQGDTVLEAGVHIGSITVPLAQLAGVQGRLVGFEPQRTLFQLAAANVALNGLWNVQLYNAGAGNVSDSTPSTPMVVYDPNALRNFGGELRYQPTFELRYRRLSAYARGARLGQHVQDEKVEMVRLMTVDELRLDACDFFKIDVEGWEEAVITGALHTVAAYKPTIYFEDNQFGHEYPSTWPDCPDAMKPLDALGYRCFHHVTPYFNPDNWRGEPTDYFRTGDDPSVSFMILCLHPSRYPDPVPPLNHLRCKTQAR